MSPLQIDRRERHVWVRLDKGKTHSIDPDMVGRLRALFEELAHDDSVGAVLLSGLGDRFFCNGLDVDCLLALNRREMTRFVDDFLGLCRDLYLFPRPLVAAINGHAMAGGLILALAADYRIVCDENRSLGFTEIRLGLPVPREAVMILSELVGNRTAHRLVLSGEVLLPEAAYRAGLVHEVTSFRHLETVAETVAAERAALPHVAYARTKRYLRSATAELMAPLAASSRDEFLECWYLPETQAALKRLAEKRRG
ncbi:MAG TPA: enoyl-CoA hydratase/isomerase family protein [Candidatus Eisenbacteria bacterium]